MTTIIISMCMVGWMAMARFIRNQVVIFRDRDYNLASRCLGSSTLRIVIKNLLPQMVSVIMLQTSLAIPGAIGDEVFLTYIGLGIPTSQASLGNLVEAWPRTDDGQHVEISACVPGSRCGVYNYCVLYHRQCVQRCGRS